MFDYFDRDLNPMDSTRNTSTDWAGKRVLRTEAFGYVVSTVWLGLNHALYSSNQPIVFETMIFGPEGEDAACVRHGDEEEAARFHLRALDAIRSGAVPSYLDDDWMGGVA